MRFFLVGRDRSTGEVRLVADDTYATRDEALTVLGDEGASAPFAGSDLFVVDLDAVSPIVLFRAPAAKPIAAEPLEEPIADVWETPDIATEGVPSAVEGDTAAGEAAVETEPEAAAEETEARDTGDLAAALRAAASSMEEAGVVAPPSVEEFAATAAIPEPGDEAAETESDEPVGAPSEESAPETGEDDPGAAGEEAASASDEEGSSVASPAVWPWTAGGEASAAGSEGDADAGFGPVGEGAVLRYLETEEPPAAEAEADADAEPGAAVDADAEAAPDARPTLGDAAPFVPVGIEEPGLEEVSVLTPAESLPDDDPPPPEQAVSEPKAYEPGEVDIANYTCDDCVYVDTCPKHHQDGPSTCGAFQWKPV